MKCPKKDCNNKAVIHNIFGVMPCKSCQKQDSKVSTTTGIEMIPISRLHRIQSQRDKGNKDMIQPYDGNKMNPEFAKAYPKLAPDYFSKKELKSI